MNGAFALPNNAPMNLIIDPPIFVNPEKIKKVPVEAEKGAVIPEQQEVIDIEPAKQETVKHPGLDRGVQFISEVAKGAIGGYIGFWVMRGLERLGIAQGIGTNPLPYILSGMAFCGIVEIGKLIYDASLQGLGERAKYEGDEALVATRLDRFRCHSWKVISKVEKLEENIDTVFSRIFHIRTIKQLKQGGFTQRDLYVMEVVRRVFFEQFRETASVAIPQELGVCLVEAFGVLVSGGHMFALHGFMFVISLFNKVFGHFQKIMEEEDAEEKMVEAKKDFDDAMTTKYEALPLDKYCEYQKEIMQKIQSLVEKTGAMKDDQDISWINLREKMGKAIDECFPAEGHEEINKTLKWRSEILREGSEGTSEKILKLHQGVLKFAIELNDLGVASREKLKASEADREKLPQASQETTKTDESLPLDLALIEKELESISKQIELYKSKIEVCDYSHQKYQD